MSLWDALRMNMMISYQELVRTFPNDPCRFLPASTREIYEQQISLDEKAGMRVICDYVSGMTDGYATKLYEKILIPRKGSIFDHLWRGKNDAPSSIGL